MTWVQSAWHRTLCSWNKHDMALYCVGHNYGRECIWCAKPGLLSGVDIDMIAQLNEQRNIISTFVDDEEDWTK